MSAYSKEPPRSRGEAESPKVVLLQEAALAAPPMQSRRLVAPPLLDELGQVATYCRTLEGAIRDERQRVDAIEARAEGDRDKLQQALLNAKLEIRRLSGGLQGAAAKIQAAMDKAAQAAREAQEFARREEIARKQTESAQLELREARSQAESARVALENRLKASQQDLENLGARLARRQAEFDEQLRARDLRLREVQAAADLVRLETTATEGRNQVLLRHLEQSKTALTHFEELKRRYQELGARVTKRERELAEMSGKRGELANRIDLLTQQNEALAREIRIMRDANRVLNENAARLESSRTAEPPLVAPAQDDTAHLRKAMPLLELLELKEKELTRLAQEIASSPEGDLRRGALSSRRDAVAMQRDQLSGMLKRITGASSGMAQPPPPPVGARSPARA